MKIWQRLFFFDTLKVLMIFLILFWGLYVLIDYSSHTGNFHHHKEPLSLFQLALFYTAELIQRSEVLLPFAILVGCTRVMTKLNTQNELVALLASGISLKRLLTPFLAVGLLGTFFLYVNEEKFIPWAMESARSLGENPKSLPFEGASHLRLQDKTLLIYQSFNKSEKTFYDVWWIPSFNEIWRFKTLSIDTPPQAEDIEKFTRDASGALIRAEQLSTKSFPEIVFNPHRLLETLTPPSEMALSELYEKLPGEAKSQKEARHLTAFWRKVFLPWLALFAVLIPAYPATRFTRRLNVFLIYVGSLFALFFIYVVFNVATLLAERQVTPPFLSLFIPFTIVSAFMAVQWIRIR